MVGHPAAVHSYKGQRCSRRARLRAGLWLQWVMRQQRQGQLEGAAAGVGDAGVEQQQQLLVQQPQQQLVVRNRKMYTRTGAGL